MTAINYRQTTISQFFKPVVRAVVTRRKIDWSDRAAGTTDSPRSKGHGSKTKLRIPLKNIDVRVEQIFIRVADGDRIYWEFKAG